MDENETTPPKKKLIRVMALENIANMTDKEIEVYSQVLWQKLTKDQ